MISEEELIETYLLPLSQNDTAALSFRDDAACLSSADAKGLIISKDLVIEGVHFLKDDLPEHIAAKALAVNLSDLAGKAARPRGFFLGLALPKAPTPSWMSAFTSGLKSLIDRHACPLLGGDITRSNGGVIISITILGTPPPSGMVKRAGASAGDHLFVSGTLGDAALGLRLRQNPELADVWQLDPEACEYLKQRYTLPEPRLTLAPLLAEYATAAMDLSDGLVEDLKKFTTANSLGAVVNLGAVPLSPAAQTALKAAPELLDDLLSWGDDYELLLAVKPEMGGALIAANNQPEVKLHEIGHLHAGSGELQFLDANASNVKLKPGPYRHF